MEGSANPRPTAGPSTTLRAGALLVGDIDAHDQRRRRIRGERAHHGLVDPLAVDELQRAGAREDAHADADEIGIPVVILFPVPLQAVDHHRADEMID
jgi:hypothetical protein